VSNKLRTPEQRAEAIPEFKRQILPLIEAGKVSPMIYQVFPFGQLAKAKAVMEANQHLGKIILAGTP
jgi:NADPH:quinone reductase-like Zn-dependent oxidoreductase